jgi:carbamoyl-phosphate synthase large subunit
MKKNRVLVYPAETEIANEVISSLINQKYIEVIAGYVSRPSNLLHGVNAIFDMGFITDDTSIKSITEFDVFLQNNSIDLLFPANDGALFAFSKYSQLLTAKVISSDYKTVSTLRSKKETYKYYSNSVPIPRIYVDFNEITRFPVFIKPVIGQGSKGAIMVSSADDFNLYTQKSSDDYIIMEYLPGDEYTIDCINNISGELLFCMPRKRSKIRNGISVKSELMDIPEIIEYAHKISDLLEIKGPWFFQMRRDDMNSLKLLEISSRIAGSSGILRALGVNLPRLSVELFLGNNVNDVRTNSKSIIQTERFLTTRYYGIKKFNHLYIDYDDTIIIDRKVNIDAINLIFSCKNLNIPVTLITKHKGDLKTELRKYYLRDLFDEIIHLDIKEKKSVYINNIEAIFIDDSYEERRDVYEVVGIPCYDVGEINVLINSDIFGGNYEE